MTGMLASVRNLKEAEMVCRGGTDIVDIKEPRHGALGAVPLSTVHCIVDSLWGKMPDQRHHWRPACRPYRH